MTQMKRKLIFDFWSMWIDKIYLSCECVLFFVFFFSFCCSKALVLLYIDAHGSKYTEWGYEVFLVFRICFFILFATNFPFSFFFWFYYCHFVLQSIDGARVLMSLQLNHFLFIFYLIFSFLLVEIRSLKTSMSFFAIRVLFVISMSELLIWLRISSQPLSFTWCISFFSHTHRSGGFFLNVYILHWLSLLLFLLVLFYFVCQFSSGSFLGWIFFFTYFLLLFVIFVSCSSQQPWIF